MKNESIKINQSEAAIRFETLLRSHLFSTTRSIKQAQQTSKDRSELEQPIATQPCILQSERIHTTTQQKYAQDQKNQNEILRSSHRYLLVQHRIRICLPIFVHRIHTDSIADTKE